ncbi:hypothetical protein K492DRAFT_206816 [Lichtheimia hyalospora FSU 10163]|nr:hypothetical protein K492DRAFT_206816 [Lichtheimia hyalospora FSU 10163]
MEFPLIRPSFSLPSPTSPSVVALPPSSSTTTTTTTTNSLPKKRPAKPHVPSACVNCQKAHLACDLSRPCRRCISSGKEGTCYDVQHKKRGRPKRRDKLSTAGESTASSSTTIATFPPLSNRNLCVLPPELPRSSFLMTRPPGNDPAEKDINKPMITIILSMEICCARVSDESLSLLGIYPHEFAHRSLYEFIPSSHASTLARVHRHLLDNAHNVSKSASHTTTNSSSIQALPPTQRTTADCFANTPPSVLMCIANGSQTLKEDFAFKTSSGQQVKAQARFYLGGGLGSDLFVPDTLGKLYIVCLAIPNVIPQAPSSISMQQDTITTSQEHPTQQQHYHDSPQHHTLPPVSSSLFTTSPSIPAISPPNFTSVLGSSNVPFSMFNATSNETASTPNNQAATDENDLILHNAPGANDYVSTSPLLNMSPSSIDISYSPASPSDVMMNSTLDADTQQYITVATSSSSPMQQQQQTTTISPSSSPASFSSHRQQSAPSSNMTTSPLLPRQSSHHHQPKVTMATPKVKAQQPEDCLLAASLDRQQDRRSRERGLLNNTWSHPREAYFREIGSSRMVSAEANAMTGFFYQSPSNAMMDALRHSTQHPSTSGSSLNPVATHHHIPSIHSARLPPLRQHPFTRLERPRR